MNALVLILALLVCPPWGSATGSKLKALNQLKNRTGVPTTVWTLSLHDLLAASGGDDAWHMGEGATIQGVVVGVRRGGPESSNCNRSGAEFEDVHVALAGAFNARPSKWVVVEITPHWRPIPWVDPFKCVGQTVRVTGWLVFDRTPTDSGRGTPWEIHPVTGIELVR